MPKTKQQETATERRLRELFSVYLKRLCEEKTGNNIAVFARQAGIQPGSMNRAFNRSGRTADLSWLCQVSEGWGVDIWTILEAIKRLDFSAAPTVMGLSGPVAARRFEPMPDPTVEKDASEEEEQVATNKRKNQVTAKKKKTR